MCFSVRLLAHGQEAIAFALPIVIYFLFLPFYISIWDYKSIIKHLSGNDFSEKGLWVYNYLIVLGTYFTVLYIGEQRSFSDAEYTVWLLTSLIILQTIGKSLLYYFFRSSKKISVLEILSSIYKLNIVIIFAALGLGLILYWLLT
jgi:hypothetical protein